MEAAFGASDAAGAWVGSFLQAADPDHKLALDDSITLWALIWPTWPYVGHRQCLLGG
ncbi:hypothetical protein [Bradyrhizobium sp. NBAIM01]|uniref:hypothetical protein n=1 Tax=Bradyrhizobium sp. NBAIM01 TaxID=2793818 RepID=UPI001CD68965|nr:hypothetical protein [Bradyrhizobium sp. NBAIM01]